MKRLLMFSTALMMTLILSGIASAQHGRGGGGGGVGRGRPATTGLERAETRANAHGQRGIENAETKQAEHKKQKKQKKHKHSH